MFSRGSRVPVHRRVAGRLARTFLRARYRTRPAPLPLVNRLVAFVGDANRLSSRVQVQPARSSLPSPLDEILGAVELGNWTLAADSLRFLIGEIERIKPHVVLEFGSGVSTVCFAHALRGDDAVVISIDHDGWFLEETRSLLRRAGLDDRVRLVSAPLVKVEYGRVSAVSYDLGHARALLRSHPPSFVLIDGPPRAITNSRYLTLPRLVGSAPPGARWFLDDALSALGIEIATGWAEIPGIAVEGICCVGNGLLT